MSPTSSRLSRATLVLVLAALTMIGPFSIDAILPAFGAIADDLRVDDTAVQQTLSVYLITFAIASLFHGSLSDALGRKPVIVVGCALYAIASVGCALAPSMPMLLGGRAAQGLVAGAGLIVGRTVVRDVYDGPSAQRFMSHISMIFAAAPAIAPIVGGWLLGWGSWRTIFWTLGGYGLLLVLLAVFLLPETHPPAVRVPFHPRPLIASFRAAALDPSVLRLSAAIGLNFAALFLYIASAPTIIVDHLGLGAQDFGVLFVPLVLALMLGSFLTGRLAGRVRQGGFVATGFVISLAGAMFAVVYQATTQEPETVWTVVPAATTSLGVALVFPILTISLLDLRPRERGAVSSFQAFLSNFLSAVVAGALAPLVSSSMSLSALVGGCLTAAAMLLWLWHRSTHRSKARSTARSTQKAAQTPGGVGVRRPGGAR